MTNAPARAPWLRVFEPMNVAAYMAWIGIGLQLWWLPADALAVGLHLSFLALFLLCALRDHDQPLTPAWRVPALIEAVVALALTALAPKSNAPVLLIIVVGQIVRAWPLPVGIGIIAVINIVLAAIFLRHWDAANALLAMMMYGGFQMFAAMTSLYSHRAEQASAELRQVNAHLLATRSLLAESARDQERLRLSRELHDVAGHKLTALKLNLTAAARDPALSENAGIATAARLADELLGDIRAVVRQMRQHDGMSLSQAIAEIAAPLPRPAVHVWVSPDARVDSVAQAEALLRAIQEALTNAARHSTADNVWIRLHRDGTRIALEVRDDGRAVGEIVFGSGLTGMRERMAALGGELAVSRPAPGGVVLSAWLPVGLGA